MTKIPEETVDDVTREVGLEDESPLLDAATLPPPQKSDPRVNVVLPSLIASTIFRSAPTSSLPSGALPTPASERAQGYVNLTVPVLEMVEFHECLGVIGELSPTVRLIIGTATLGIAAAIMMPRVKKSKKPTDSPVEGVEPDSLGEREEPVKKTVVNQREKEPPYAYAKTPKG